MGRVFRNQQEIPIPDFAYVNASDGRVFTIHRDERNKRQHITIGWATSKVTMHPNETSSFSIPNSGRSTTGNPGFSLMSFMSGYMV